METSFADLMKQYDAETIYTTWRIRCRAVNRILGGWPKNSDTELAMLEARRNRGLVKDETVDALKEKMKQAATENEDEAASDAMERAWTGFKSDAKGIYLESRQVKAGIREVATTLGFTTQYGWRQILQHSLFVMGETAYDPAELEAILQTDPGFSAGDRVYFSNAQGHLLKPDGAEKMIAHVISAQGPRSTIKFHDYVESGTEFEFYILRSAAKKAQDAVTEEHLVKILAAMRNNGLGCSRSQGFGRFEVLTMTKVTEGKFDIVLAEKKTAIKGKGKKVEVEARLD